MSKKHQLRRIGAGRSQCFAAAIDDLHLVPAQLQQQREAVRRVHIVIDDQNAQRLDRPKIASDGRGR